jgi:hypothetical protein
VFFFRFNEVNPPSTIAQTRTDTDMPPSTFSFSPVGGFSLQNEKYGWCKVKEDNVLRCIYAESEKDKFTIIRDGDQGLAIMASNGKWCSDDNHKIVCDRDRLRKWELFQTKQVDDNGQQDIFVHLKGGRNKQYCQVTGSGEIECEATLEGLDVEDTLIRIQDTKDAECSVQLEGCYTQITNTVLNYAQQMNKLKNDYRMSTSQSVLQGAYTMSASQSADAEGDVSKAIDTRMAKSSYQHTAVPDGATEWSDEEYEFDSS